MMKGLLFFIKFSWKERKSYIILNAVSQLLIGILPIAIIAIPKYIIDELMEQQRMETMILYVVLLLAAIFINSWGISHVNLLIFNQRCYLSARFSKFMHEKLANTDFCNLEKPDYFEIREKANKFLYGDWHGFSYVIAFFHMCFLCGVFVHFNMGSCASKSPKYSLVIHGDAWYPSE